MSCVLGPNGKILVDGNTGFGVLFQMHHWCVQSFGKSDLDTWWFTYAVPDGPAFHLLVPEHRTLFLLRWQ